jgi:hypothetical protein
MISIFIGFPIASGLGMYLLPKLGIPVIISWFAVLCNILLISLVKISNLSRKLYWSTIS